MHNFCATLVHLESTLAGVPATVDSKQLTEMLNYLESTLTKNRGEAEAVMVNQIPKLKTSPPGGFSPPRVTERGSDAPQRGVPDAP
jgi:hypothetical protein